MRNIIGITLNKGSQKCVAVGIAVAFAAMAATASAEPSHLPTPRPHLLKGQLIPAQASSLTEASSYSDRARNSAKASTLDFVRERTDNALAATATSVLPWTTNAHSPSPLTEPVQTHLAFSLTDKIGLRGDVTWIQFSRYNPLTSIAQSLEPRLLSVGLVADFFPSEADWFVSAGMRLNWNRLRETSRFGVGEAPHSLANAAVQPAGGAPQAIAATMNFADLSPYIGFGYEGELGNMSMGFQAGAFWTGALKAQWGEGRVAPRDGSPGSINLEPSRPDASTIVPISPVLAVSLGYRL